MTPDLRILRDKMDTAAAVANARAAELPVEGSAEWDRLILLREEAESASDAFVAAILSEVERACNNPEDGHTDATPLAACL